MQLRASGVIRFPPRLLLVAGLGACIIPDRGIRLEDGDDNPGAVRILERPPLDAELRELCESGDAAFCPAAPPGIPSGLLLPEQDPDDDVENFCVCPGPDNRAIDRPFSIYAEDPDTSRDTPSDTLYGALLLDPDPLSESPEDDVAYGNYLERCGAGELLADVEDADPLGTSATNESRNPPHVWRFIVGDISGIVDLCNDNSGSRLPVGLHNLQFMVTDRPFFKPPRRDADGEILRDERGKISYGPEQCGVPDLAGGATYAVTNYVFECGDASEGSDDDCDCAEVEPQ